MLTLTPDTVVHHTQQTNNFLSKNVMQSLSLKHEFLMGHGSNDPQFLYMECVPVEVTSMCVCLVDTSSAEVPACYRFGPAFTAADIMGTMSLALQEGISYKVVHLPLALPFPFGVNDTTKGTITEVCQRRHLLGPLQP
jgi:hypothetical protein